MLFILFRIEVEVLIPNSKKLKVNKATQEWNKAIFTQGLTCKFCKVKTITNMFKFSNKLVKDSICQLKKKSHSYDKL